MTAAVTLPLDEIELARYRFEKGGRRLTAVAVYVAIAELAALGEEATNDSIAERAGASAPTVYNYLSPLTEAGIVDVEKPPRGPWLYRPAAPQAGEVDGLRGENRAMRSLLDDLGVTPAQIRARLEA
jgi:DNA-binding transcriptional ArsR family regulator